jgi:uncharacterized protein YacL
MNFQTMSKQRKFVLIASAVGFISIFLPWVSISMGPFGSMSTNGFHGAGILVFLCFAACGVLAFLGDQTKNLVKTFWMITLIAGGLAAAIMLINFLRALDNLSYLSIGFYLALLASIGVVLATYMFRNPEDTLKSGFDSLKNQIEEKAKGGDTPSTGS